MLVAEHGPRVAELDVPEVALVAHARLELVGAVIHRLQQCHSVYQKGASRRPFTFAALVAVVDVMAPAPIAVDLDAEPGAVALRTNGDLLHPAR